MYPDQVRMTTSLVTNKLCPGSSPKIKALNQTGFTGETFAEKALTKLLKSGGLKIRYEPTANATIRLVEFVETT